MEAWVRSGLDEQRRIVYNVRKELFNQSTQRLAATYNYECSLLTPLDFKYHFENDKHSSPWK